MIFQEFCAINLCRNDSVSFDYSTVRSTSIANPVHIRWQTIGYYILHFSSSCDSHDFQIYKVTRRVGRSFNRKSEVSENSKKYKRNAFRCEWVRVFVGKIYEIEVKNTHELLTTAHALIPRAQFFTKQRARIRPSERSTFKILFGSHIELSHESWERLFAQRK